jgi:hypothetical protein
VDRRRKDNAKYSVTASPALNERPSDVVDIELKNLPSIASEPTKIEILCPRCGQGISRQIKREYTPIPEVFQPFYERARDNDLNALVDYYKERWGRSDLGSAFYQCLGYFVAKSFPEHVKVVKTILRMNERGGGAFNQRPAKIAIYWNWNRTYSPMAKQIDKWLKAKRRELDKQGISLPRHELWRSCRNEMFPLLDEKTNKNQYHKGVRELFWCLAQRNPRHPASQAVRIVACRIAGISTSSVSHKKLAQMSSKVSRKKK